jgi:hypothetical protein
MADKFGLPHIIAIDFDGTLVEDQYPEIGKPIYSIVLRLEALKKYGSKIILWTCRSGKKLDEAVKFCKDVLHIEFDAINENIPETQELFGCDTRKVYATEYWDDKNFIPMTGWSV